jgi:hypothetical protein
MLAHGTSIILHGRPHSNHADQTTEDHRASVSSPNSPMPLRPPSSSCNSTYQGVRPSLPIQTCGFKEFWLGEMANKPTLI